MRSRPELPEVEAIATTRRHFLRGCGAGLGAVAAASLLGEDGLAAPGESARPLVPTHPARAKHVIYLQMAGAPPPQDLFDHKPKLGELHGELCPTEFIEGKRLAFIKGHPTLLGSQQRFVPAGESGVMMNELAPHMASILDQITIVRSMHTTEFNHAPADLFLFTGKRQVGGASMGSWATYGLGSPNKNLPGFVVMVSGGSDPTGGKSTWGSGFLPSEYQGVRLRGQGDPVLYVSNPSGMSSQVRRRSLDALRELNEIEHEEAGDPETRARIEQYELAYRMQAAVPEVMDIQREPEEVRALYGADPSKASFANNCLLARRLVENGVRFVQLFDWGWDMHGTGPDNDLVTGLPKKLGDVDRPVAALIEDLSRRGLLDETLVVWGGEFGRTSMNEKRNGSVYLGRDHHADCFTIWMAGAGIHRGRVYGATDELGYTITADPVGVHDLQATILHLLGLDPYSLRYPYQGLEQRLIGPSESPRVVTELFA
ncbi:MAG: DUF1501 domain-containing protein [Planctomycetota bacterium]|jgi:hypothetical protein|nr:DUF1501 domain-containing protein [Planctomycetota bacterium]MDP6763609.1 DUF1501 domain-containing protein [Planctomycetota bacterium]MDP6989716.1 DUF1501 domain-containing protein [Planctomycetota bacterium]